ncbi:MAG TPA: hypothetical protein VFZ53_22360, partial [Polyangiaceae bacterium]
LRRSSTVVLASAALAALPACGGAAAPPQAPADKEPAVAAASPPELVPAEPPAEPAAAEAPAPDGASADSKPASNGDEQRSIRYVQTPEGLRVEILGVKFVPKAEAVKTPAGIGLKLTLEATAAESRSLSAPEHGPLAFAGTIKRKGKSEPESFGDERKGDGELVLEPDKPTKLVRQWPGPKGGALGNGDVLELDVGLWGLGANAAERRPVKQFLRVKVVVENWKGRARVEPPPSAKGQG